MGPFVSNQIDLGKFPFVRKAMYWGGVPVYIRPLRNNGTEILQGRCCIFFRNFLRRLTNVQILIMSRRDYFPL